MLLIQVPEVNETEDESARSEKVRTSRREPDHSREPVCAAAADKRNALLTLHNAHKRTTPPTHTHTHPNAARRHLPPRGRARQPGSGEPRPSEAAGAGGFQGCARVAARVEQQERGSSACRLFGRLGLDPHHHRLPNSINTHQPPTDHHQPTSTATQIRDERDQIKRQLAGGGRGGGGGAAQSSRLPLLAIIFAAVLAFLVVGWVVRTERLGWLSGWV